MKNNLRTVLLIIIYILFIVNYFFGQNKQNACLFTITIILFIICANLINIKNN